MVWRTEYWLDGASGYSLMQSGLSTLSSVHVSAMVMHVRLGSSAIPCTRGPVVYLFGTVTADTGAEDTSGSSADPARHSYKLRSFLTTPKDRIARAVIYDRASPVIGNHLAMSKSRMGGEMLCIGACWTE